MATYADLGLEQFAQLSVDDFVNLELNESSAGTCIWSNTLISALQNAIGTLETKIDLLADAMVALQTNLQTHGDSNWKTAEGFLTSSPSANDIASEVWNYGEDYTSRTVKANGVSLESTELSVNIDSTEIANRVWSNTSRTLTSGENINFPEFNTSDLAKAEQVENVAKVSDLEDLAKSADIVQVQEDVINIQNTMADVFPKILNSQQLQVGLLGHWKVEEDVLVIFDENGDKISEILLTKDKKGNIIQMGSTQE